ncbi:GTP cyclohydrolase II [Aquimarina algicola]|uniref:GTP cyclohydrolase n=1 Tax=Aquimarina algicola TaxID=2589995 RepID=A0A504J4P9_9FLAO|nr:GTP cyclohydrolase [Aquimarina algicola]TPN85936.1 GTP cyclohydrolase [Aquimarina algicola]
MIIKLAETELKTKFGEYREILFYDGQQESHALIMGDIDGEEDVLCRIHSSCIFAHHFNSIECDCREQMEISQQLIQKEGKGIIVWLEQEGKGNGHLALLKSIPHKRAGLSQAEAYKIAGYKEDARDFTPAAKILNEIGVTSIRMLTNNPKKVDTLTKHGIVVTGTQPTILDV